MKLKPRVLLIDDNEVILEGLKLHLTNRFEVSTVCDGFDAMTRFADQRFDLIIADLIMPSVSGFGLIASLKLLHPNTPLIAMSGWGSPSQRHELNVNLLLLKPFDLEELDQSIDELLPACS